MLENNRALAPRYGDDDNNLLVPATRMMPAPISSAERTNPSILTIIWRRRWVFFGCIVLAMAAAVVYLAKATPLYSSSSQIYVQQSAPKALADVLATGPNPMNYLYTQCDLIKSTAIIQAALEAPEVRQTKTLRAVENPVGYLKRATDATVGKQSDLITVSVETPNPEDSAVLTNAIVDAYINYQTKRQQTTASELLAMLQKEKDNADKELRETSKAMVAFRQTNGTLSFEGDKGNVVTQRLEQLSNELTQAQLQTLQATLMLDAAKALGDDPAKLKQLVMSEHGNNTPVSAIDNQDLWQDYRKLQRSYEQALNLYGPDHRLVKAYQLQLENLKKDMDSLDGATVGNYKAVLQQQLVKAKAREEEIAKAVDAQRAAAMELNGKAAEYQQLELDARRAQSTLDMLYSRIKELNVTQDTPQRIDILETARPSGTPVKPNRPQAAGIALVIGLMLGLGGSLLQDWMDQRMRSVEEIRAVLDLPVLGIIPHMFGKQPAQERGQEVHLKPRSNVAEAYRTVRTAIFFGVPDPKSKTLLVTSPSPGDGKTTMASNLAIAIAQSGRRVLLIDADTRKPMMHRIFNLKDEVGVSTVLLGQSKLEASIQRTAVEHLDVMPCGPLPPNPSEILNSQAFLDMINLLCLKYDQIVIDSPPVEPVTDARILAASCDTTVLVLRAEKSTRRLSAHARDALIGVGANLLGVIVNAVPRGQDGYSYYSGYGYYRYGYGHRATGEGSSPSPSSSGNGHKEIKAITVDEA
jgi:capsular exopolysaccharide synthesis family protein